MHKDFIKRLLSIAVPVTLQNLIASSLNLVDTIMIGSLVNHQALIGFLKYILIMFL